MPAALGRLRSRRALGCSQRRGAAACGRRLQAGIPRSARDAWSRSWHKLPTGGTVLGTQLGSLPASQAGAQPKSQPQHLSHILPPPPAQLGTPGQHRAPGQSWDTGPLSPPWGRAPRPPGTPNLPPRGNPGQQRQLGLRKGAGCPRAAPFSPRAAPPHVLPPARQRGPWQPGAAGVRQQAHPQVHRGGQGHGEESGEEPLVPQNPVPGRAGRSSRPLPAA